MIDRSRSLPVLLLVVAACSSWLSEHQRLLEQLPEAEAIGDQSCAACHRDQAKRLKKTVHAEVLGCETCHGPGGRHVTSPPANIAGKDDLSRMTARGKSEMCLDCHEAMVRRWARADHAKAVPCFDCHSNVVHFDPPRGRLPPSRFSTQMAFCQQCHLAGTLGMEQLFHHPVRDGEVECRSCHSVHGQNRPDFVLQDGGVCGRCHLRQAGPKVFRHPALDEGCAVCHRAHGSPLRALLLQRGNNICLQCHFEPGFPVIEGVNHTDFLASGALCFDCHVQVHGSNSDPSLLGRLR